MRLIVLVAILATSGCTTIDQAARGINAYCAVTTPLEQEVFRARLDIQTYPHRARVECDRATTEAAH